MTVSQIQTLFEYNYWANARVQAAVSAVEESVFLAPARGGRGSLRSDLVHVLAIEWMWRVRCQKGNSPPQYIPAERFLQAESVCVAWKEEEKAMRTYLDGLQDVDLVGPVRYRTRQGEWEEKDLWQILWHVVNHGTQHRAEIALHLAEVGHAPGDLDFIEYLRQA